MAIGAALLFALAGAGTASAHAELESTDPSQSAVLIVPPRQVVLHFDEPVEIDFGSVTVFGPRGTRVDEGGTHHPSGDSHSVAVPLPSGLGKGTYVVAWRVISADSHPVHGAFLFSVGSAAGAVAAHSLANALSAATGSTAVGVVFGVIRFVVFAGLLVLVGLTATVMLVWRGAARMRRVRRVLWASWAVLLLGTIASIAVQGVYAAALPLAHVFNPSLFGEVLHTRFGEVAGARIVLLIAAVPILSGLGAWAEHRRAGRWWLLGAAVLGLGLLATPGLSGHAATTGNPAVGMALDLGHLGAAALWIGGLALLAAVLIPGVPAAERPPDSVELARRFSPFALGAVAVVVATGLLQSVRQVGSIYALLNTVYGLTLLTKVALVTVLVGLGAVSRRLVVGRWAFAVPRRSAGATDTVPTAGEPGAVDQEPLDASRATAADCKGRTVATLPVVRRRRVATTRLQRSVLAEVTVAAAVLMVTALLVNAVPAKLAAAQPFVQTFDVLGVQVNAIVDPARVGTGNQFHFYVLGSLGQPQAIPSLTATIRLPESRTGAIEVPLVVASPGHFQASDVDIPEAGRWRLEVTIRTSVTDEATVHANVPVR